jgi:hypothetical protein
LKPTQRIGNEQEEMLMRRIASTMYLVAGVLALSVAAGASGETPAAAPATPAAVGINNFADVFRDPALQARLQRRIQERLAEKAAQQAAGSPPAGPTPRRGKLPLTATDFAPATARVVPEPMAERMAHGSSARQTELLAMFNGILDTLETQTRRSNVAAAMAFAMAASEQVLADRGTLNPERYGELVVQINDDLGDSDEFKALPDRRKQEIYESSLLTAGLIVGAYRQAMQRSDSTLQQQAKTAAADYLSKMNGAP